MIDRWRRMMSVKWLFLLAIAPVFSFLYLDTIRDPVFSAHRDFGVFYTASTLVWRGEALLLFEPDAFRAALAEIMGESFPYLPFPYPPHSLLIFLPLAAFPFLVALALWLSAGLLGIAAVLWRPLMRHWATALAFLLGPASAVNMAAGQNGFVSAALLCGGLMQLPHRPILAGMLFGLMSYKPQLGVLVPLILMAGGHWRAFWSASACVSILVLASLLLFGQEAWLLYFTRSGPQQLQLAQYWVGRFQEMSPTYFMFGRLAGFALWQAWTLQVAAALGGTAGAIWAYRQANVPHALKVAVVLIAIFIISPYALTYDMPMVSLALLLALTTFKPRWWESLVFAAVWVTPALAQLVKIPFGPFLMTIAFLMLLYRAWMLRTELPTGRPTSS